MYHIVVEALLAQPGQHFICDYLERARPAARLPRGHGERRAGRAAPHRLRRQAAARPAARRSRACARRSPTCSARSRRTRSRSSSRPGWDRSYTECFGFTLEEIYTEGARSFEAKLRSAGPAAGVAARARRCSRSRCRAARARASTALAMLQRRVHRRAERHAAARPGDDGAAVRPDAPARVDHRTAPAGPLTVQWEFTDAEPWHLRVDNGSTARGAGPRAATSTSSCAAATRTGSTSSPGGWTRGARSPRAGCARTARRARCGRRAACSESCRGIATSARRRGGT